MSNEEVRLECLKLAGTDTNLAKRFSDYVLYEKIGTDDKPKSVVNPKKGKR